MQIPAAIYVAKPEFIPLLRQELKGVTQVVEDLVFTDLINYTPCFAQDIWLHPKIITFDSISEAVKILRQEGKYWYLHPISHVRRSRLIEEQLRTCPELMRDFPIHYAIAEIGAFTLLDKNTLVYSSRRWKKWPDGNCYFVEDKINPPNRAYLKLWEALTLLGKYPKKGETALDLGASPGGWTYVMQSLGAEVTAIDKAELAEKIAAKPRVHFLKQSAFALDPLKLEKTYDWVLSDIACYPEKAYALIKKYLDSGKAKQLIFTIKLQGQLDWNTIKPFQAIENAQIFNLHHNKHELTFFYPKPNSLEF